MKVKCEWLKIGHIGRMERTMSTAQSREPGA